MTQTAWLIEMAWKGSAILIAAFAGAALLRRSSAASRHFLWSAAFAVLLLLPPAIWLSPQWRASTPAAGPETRAATTVHVHPVIAPANFAPPDAWSPWLLVWAFGCVLASLRFAAGAAQARSMLQGSHLACYAVSAMREAAKTAGISRQVRVVESELAHTPLVCRTFRPVIVLPKEAASWTGSRLRTALLHEATHIARRDIATQALANAACCLYWFHPLAWMAEREQRRERERACDDAVLATGTSAHDYADDLLAMARSMGARRLAAPNTAAMAEGSNLEQRIQAMLDPRRDRRPVRLRAIAIAAVALAALLAPAASVRVRAQNGQGSLTGVVEDPSGGRVPNCNIVAQNRDGSNRETTTTNAAGEYQFSGIPAGNYDVEFAARGFARAKRSAAVPSAGAARADAHLTLGGLRESLQVTGRRPPAAPQSQALASAPIRIGGNVQAAKLIFHPDPIYSEELRQAGIEGTVTIEAIVGKDGLVQAARAVNTDVDVRLVKQALDAVEQWRYQPTLLNNAPVSVTTTIEVHFTLN